MPTDPRTWSEFDQVTATRLNGDLYCVDGGAFLPTGIQFHARKPVYKAIQAEQNIAIAAQTWRGMFEQRPANVVVDNAGWYGAQMDPDFSGTIADAIAYSDGNPAQPNPANGNLIGNGGGWYLTSAWTALSGGSANTLYRCNIANGPWTGNNPNLISSGVNLEGNNNRDICPFVVDLVNYDGGSYTPVILNQGTSPVNMHNSADGSGESCYFQAHWASIYKNHGFTAAQPNPQPSWGSTSTVTASLLNGPTGIRDVLRVLNMPPMLRVTSSVSTNCPDSTPTVINLGTSSADTYSAYSNSTNTYVVPFGGLFFAYGVVTFSGTGTFVPARCSIRVNGTDFWGPWSTMQAGSNNGVAKLGMLDLQAGDTVQLVGEQNCGSTLGTATSIPPILILLWMSRYAAPSPIPTLPDLSFRYTAGMGAAATLAAFNDHLANDLNFLVHKPLLMSTQQNAQSVPQGGTGQQLNMDTIGGIVHNSNGDPYGGWDSVHQRYVAPVTGWYLATSEVFFGTPSLTSTPSTVALIGVSTSGGAASAWDWYGHMNLTTGAGRLPGGAHAMGYYLLRGGQDWIAPGVITQDTASGNFSTYVAGPNSHFEVCYISQ